jgi:UDP-glucose 4-epimerase
MSRCLVLGAGLLGGHVAWQLRREGHDVTVLSRGINPWFDEARRDGIELHLGRIETETELLGELVGNAECVIHLASSSRPPLAVQAPVVDVEQTLTPALTVMQHLSHFGRDKRLITCSSGGTVYGSPHRVPTPEDHPFQPTTPYAVTHVALEYYLEYYRHAHGLESVTLRFANVYGPGELGRGGQGVIGTWLHQIAIGERPVLLGDMTISRDYVYVEDAARAVGAVITKPSPVHAYNVGSSSTTTLYELLEILRDVTGAEIEPTPGPPAFEHATGGIPLTLLDTTRINEDTGWTPSVRLEEGVSRTWEWLRTEWMPLVEGRSAQPVDRQPGYAH